MKNNIFFKSTPLFKEFLLLDNVEKNSKITQRELSILIGASLSMINSYIDEYEKKGYLKRVYITNKNIEYHITKEGINRKKLLNISYLKSSYDIYNSAKKNILTFLFNIINKGINNVYLYGAGEVAKIMLIVLTENQHIPLKVLGIIDDDLNKQGKYIFNIPIVNIQKLNEIEHDGVLISTYKHDKTILNRLIKINYNSEKIFTFFDN